MKRTREDGRGAASTERQLISNGLWKRRYGADPKILGKTLTMDDESYTVIGVMPPGFQHPSPCGVLKLVLEQGFKLASVGVALGIAGVFAAQKLTASMIYGVSPIDPWTLAGGTLFLLAVGLVGTLVPAGRASHIDPVLALRQE
jgi:hypothetical protein